MRSSAGGKGGKGGASRGGGHHWGPSLSADRVGPWDHGAMGPRALGDHGAMRRAVRAGRAEQVEGGRAWTGGFERMEPCAAMGP